jgi:hypothetical protein
MRAGSGAARAGRSWPTGGSIAATDESGVLVFIPTTKLASRVLRNDSWTPPFKTTAAVDFQISIVYILVLRAPEPKLACVLTRLGPDPVVNWSRGAEYIAGLLPDA